jgi:hypothetical protein
LPAKLEIINISSSFVALFGNLQKKKVLKETLLEKKRVSWAGRNPQRERIVEDCNNATFAF